MIQSTVHRGTKILPFFAKRKRKRRGGQASVPLHPLLPGEDSPRTPPRREGLYVFGNILCLARPALYRAGLFVVGAHAKHLVQQRAGVRRRAVLGRGRARNPLPCLARGLQRALPSDVEGCGGISEAPAFLVLLSHKSTNRPSMRRGLNAHRTPHLLSPCLSFLLSPYPRLLPSHACPSQPRRTKKEPAGPFLWLPAPCMGPA